MTTGCFATEIHKLEARLWRRVQRDNLRVILFTSAIRGEGKSTTAAYLAAAMGLHPSRRVLAVDLDFRAPRLGRNFQLEVTTSIGAVIRGECPIQDAIVGTELPNLDLLGPLHGRRRPEPPAADTRSCSRSSTSFGATTT